MSSPADWHPDPRARKWRAGARKWRAGARRGWLGWAVAAALAVVAVAAVLGGGSGPGGSPVDGARSDVGPSAGPDETPSPTTDVVRSVTDGDTVSLRHGEAVRLVGVDAPERGACGSRQATDLLADLTLGRRVTLSAPVDDRDRYGRLLRYVDVGTTDAGLELISAGLAVARYDSRDGYDAHPRQGRYVRRDAATADVTCAPAPFAAPVRPRDTCVPGYSPCIPPPPPDLDCPDTGPVDVSGADPHRLDADGDGAACAGSDRRARHGRPPRHGRAAG